MGWVAKMPRLHECQRLAVSWAVRHPHVTSCVACSSHSMVVGVQETRAEAARLPMTLPQPPRHHFCHTLLVKARDKGHSGFKWRELGSAC